LNLPHEKSETVKAILVKDIPLKDKAKMIYRYSEMVIKRKYGIGRGVRKPILTEKEIEKILLDREIELAR
jgi:hypothetical protein